MKSKSKLCSRCKERPKRPGQAWCQPCHTAYCRQWRPKSYTKDELRARIELLETTLDTVLAQLGPGTKAWKRGVQVLKSPIVSVELHKKP